MDNSSAGIKYIDTSRVMKSKGFGTVDGLHYTESTNRLIYNTVRGVLNRDYACLSESAITMNKEAVRDSSLCNSGSSKWSFFVGNKNIISAKKLPSISPFEASLPENASINPVPLKNPPV